VGTVRPRADAVLLVCCATLLWLAAAVGGQAQTAAIDELKGKIFDARMAQQTFADGLKHCDELNGKSFYFQLRHRILNLEEYFQSLENLVKAEVYNPAKRRVWSLEDAKERWDEVKRQAEEDRRKCELVQNLPAMESKLHELENNAAVDRNE
jgi:tRNA nucleotidyltransferase/poly(A) polymerase